MRVLFLVPYPSEGASNRYRVEQYLPFLKEADIGFLVRSFWCGSAFKVLYKKGHFCIKSFYFLLGTFLRFFDIFRACRYDVVFVHREAYPIFGAFFEKALSLLKIPLIFDFDDAIFLPVKSSSNNFIEFFKNPGKTSKIIAMSAGVIAGNSYLADYALRFNKGVVIIPTAIDTDRYLPEKNRSGNELIIGWIGSPTTLDFVKGLESVFCKLLLRFKNVKIKIIGGDLHINRLSNIINQPWSLASEIECLRSFDIGIMPVPDNDWTRGKCGFKAILYMSMAIPCLCSPVGVNKEIIEDGLNGFLARTEDEWVQKLSLLIQDPLLRERIGRNGRETIEKKYSVKANARKFLEAINSAAGYGNHGR